MLDKTFKNIFKIGTRRLLETFKNYAYVTSKKIGFIATKISAG